MNQARIGLLVMAAMIAAPSFAHAQKKKKPAAKPAPAAPAAPPSGPAVDAAAAGVAPLPPAQGPTEIDADAPAGAAPTEPAAPEGPTPEPDDLDDICKIDPATCPTMDLATEAKKDLKEQMYAVQQIYALHYHRFEIQPT